MSTEEINHITASLNNLTGMVGALQQDNKVLKSDVALLLKDRENRQYLASNSILLGGFGLVIGVVVAGLWIVSKVGV